MDNFYAKYPVSGGGVTSLNGLTGALTLAAGSGIGIASNGLNTLTISNTQVQGVTTLAPVGSTPNANAGIIAGQVLTLEPANTSFPGVLLAADWNTFNNKQNALTFGNLTDVGTDGIVVTNGTGSVIGSGTSIAQQVSDATHNGYLSSADWSSFNAKAPAGNYITALTGDATASGPGSAVLTLATVNSNVGTFGSATAVSTLTVNAKGLITAVSNTPIQIAESQVTNLVSDLAGKQPTGNYITALTGDVTASGPGSSATTLATVNASPGSFTYASLTVNAKGLVTSASSGAAPVTTLAAVGAVPNANAGTISGNTLNLQPFDATHPGVVTASGGGTTNFLRADGTWAAASGGTLKAPTIQKFLTGSGTYTRPATIPLYIRVVCIGGGGGGGGVGNTVASPGNDGLATTFGASLISAGGGLGGGAATGLSTIGNGGAGGTSTLGTGPLGLALTGTTGGFGASGVPGGDFPSSGYGGSGFFGGGGGSAGGASSVTGNTASTNTGAGGSGAADGSGRTASGGGSGGYVDAIITSISSTYAYSVGAAGTGGTGATRAGGDGAAGLIIVYEYYQ